MKTVYITIGCAGSGKSSYIEKIISDLKFLEI